MARLTLALLVLFPVVAGCIDGRQGGGAPQGPKRVGPGLSLTDIVRNARRDGRRPRAAGDPPSTLGIEPGTLVDLPTVTFDPPLRGGAVDGLGGAQKWERTVGAAGWDSVQQVVRYHGDEVAVIGWIEGSVDFGGLCGVVKPGRRSQTVDFLYASYLARFNDAGVCQWINAFDSDDAWPAAVAVDAAYNIYVAGMFDTEVRFGAGFDLATSDSGEDVFIARFTSGGALDWTRSISGTSDAWAYDAAVVEDGDGADLVLVGSFDGTAELDGATTLTSSGGYDMLVARWSSTGALAFASAIGGEGREDAGAVAVLGTDMVVAGTFDSAVLSVGGVASFTNAGGYDSALIALSGGGAPQWAVQLGGEGPDWIADIAPVGSDVAVVGAFAGAVSFAGLPELASAGTSMLVAKVNSSGAGQWAHSISSAGGLACATAVRGGASGDLYLAAVIDGDAAFGATTISPDAGAWSVVSARYAGSGAETPLWTSQHDRVGALTTPLLGLSDEYVVLSADVEENGGDMALYGLGL